MSKRPDKIDLELARQKGAMAFTKYGLSIADDLDACNDWGRGTPEAFEWMTGYWFEASCATDAHGKLKTGRARGAASITISLRDGEIEISHTDDETVLARKVDTDPDDWDRLWVLLTGVLGVTRTEDGS